MVPGMVERDSRAVALRREAELARALQSGQRRTLPSRARRASKQAPEGVDIRHWAGRLLPRPRPLVLAAIAAFPPTIVRTALRRLGPHKP